jgi:hypothetical protein
MNVINAGMQLFGLVSVSPVSQVATNRRASMGKGKIRLGFASVPAMAMAN